MPAKFILTIMDGCRPDGLAQATTPNLDSLWQNGAYSWQARSIMPSISLPCHSSMFRSVLPEKHGIYDNVYVPSAAQYPATRSISLTSIPMWSNLDSGKPSIITSRWLNI